MIIISKHRTFVIQHSIVTLPSSNLWMSQNPNIAYTLTPGSSGLITPWSSKLERFARMISAPASPNPMRSSSVIEKRREERRGGKGREHKEERREHES